jgi:hypothetical protein
VTPAPQRKRIAVRNGVAALLLAAGAGCASTPDLPTPLAALATPLPLRDDAAGIFGDGETLVYDVAFGPFRVGELTYRTAALETDGRPALRFEGVTRPRGIFAAFARAGGTTRCVVDAETLHPSSSFWVTAEKKDPMVRVASFDPALARTAVYQDAWSMTRTHRGATFFDPVSGMMFLRALAPPPPNEERRLIMVEGVRLHLLTVRTVGLEALEARTGEVPRAALKLAIRGDLLGDDGALTGEDPLNNFFLWLAETPRHEPLRLEGRIALGGVTLTLR